MTDDTPHADEKYIRVMPYYISNGIWHRDGLHADPEELPVSNELLVRLAQWSDWYNVNDDFLPEDERKNQLNWDEFEKEGVEIARAIKRELPDWTVVWHDERKLVALVRAGEEPRPCSSSRSFPTGRSGRHQIRQGSCMLFHFDSAMSLVRVPVPMQKHEEHRPARCGAEGYIETLTFRRQSVSVCV